MPEVDPLEIEAVRNAWRAANDLLCALFFLPDEAAKQRELFEEAFMQWRREFADV